MLIVLSDQHRGDLKFLKKVDPETLNEFCTIVMLNIQEGPRPGILSAASKKYNLDEGKLKVALDALSFLFAEASRLSLSELDFVDSLLVLSFSEDVNAVLRQHYLDSRDRVRRVLESLNFDFDQYENLHWRLNVQTSSRFVHSQAKSSFLIQLDTKRIGSSDVKSSLMEIDPVDLRHITEELETAQRELKQGYVKRVLRNVK